MENTRSNNGFLSKIIALILILKLISSPVYYKEPQYTNHKKSKRKEENNAFDIMEALKHYLDINLNNLTTNDNKDKSKKKKKRSKDIEKQTNNTINNNDLNFRNYKKNKEKNMNNFKKDTKQKNQAPSDNIQINKNSEKKLKNNVEITSYEKSIKEHKFNNIIIEEAMVSNVSSINLEKSVFDTNNKKEIKQKNDIQHSDIQHSHEPIDDKKEMNHKKIPNEDYNKLNDEKTLIVKKSLEGKIPVFIETKIIKYPIKIKAHVNDKIIEIENFKHKVIKFDTKLSRNIEDEKKPEILLFYNGVIRTVVNYICFDNKDEDIVNGKYNTIILYNNVSGFTEIDSNKFKEKNKTDLNDIKIDLKDTSFYTDFLLQNQHELEHIPDSIYDKFVILGETTFKLDVLCETYLNILS